jgi:hypothetical protein
MTGGRLFPVAVVLSGFLALALIEGTAAGRAAAEPPRADPAKITGCWRVWVKGTDKERRRTFEITKLTDGNLVEGLDTHGRTVSGHFEPADRPWFGYLGTLVLYMPTEPLGGYGSDVPERSFRHPVFSLEPAEMFFPSGPTMAPGTIRPFAMYDAETGRGLTIGTADRLYRCEPEKMGLPVYEGPEPMGADPPQGP